MTPLLMDAPTSVRFALICRIVQARGRGMDLGQLGDAHALARELEEGRPQSDLAQLCRERLQLTAEGVA